MDRRHHAHNRLNNTSSGHLNPPVVQRAFWATMEGIIAAVLLLGGGLLALRTAVVATGLPFAVVLLVLGVSLVRGMAQDRDREKGSAPEAVPSDG